MVSRMSRSARQSIGSGVKVGPEEKFPIALVPGQWIALVDKAEAIPDLTGDALALSAIQLIKQRFANLGIAWERVHDATLGTCKAMEGTS